MDEYGRRHNNLRISVTDRCNLRCIYCMDEEVTFLDRAALLTFEEITRFVTIATSLGIDKVRLTGGEPLMRQKLPDLVHLLKSIPNLKNIGLTTNGLLLAERALDLYQAGLRTLNVSLDSLDPQRFRQMARRDGLNRVLDGLHVAQKIGFERIKVNAVIIRGMNEQDIPLLAQKARAEGWEMRFIEYMPIGAETWERNKVVFAHEILDILEKSVAPLVPAHDFDSKAPAMDFEYADTGARVGIIASVSRPFCMNCNRLRLTCDGKLRNCLFALEETDVKDLLRRNASSEEIVQAIRQNVRSKWEGHEINTARFIKPLRTMHAIGG
ncbi:MAG: GTP 3',8-cyclase MoaA [Gemmataceae bacterium]